MQTIFSAILERSSDKVPLGEATLLRKLAMWAICLIMLSPRERFLGLPTDLAQEVIFFKEEVGSDNHFGGKVQLNPIPENVKHMIN